MTAQYGVLLTIAYDGTLFSGWASQREVRTVEDTVRGAIAALDAILTEWSSSDSYSLRISKIMNGLGPDGTDALNSTTCQSDGVANTVSDGTAAGISASVKAVVRKCFIRLSGVPGPIMHPTRRPVCDSHQAADGI